MGILHSLFGSIDRTPECSRDPQHSPSPGQDKSECTQEQYSDTYDVSRGMLKEATQLRSVDPRAAIEKIQQAIQLCPEKVLEDYFKLTSYLADIGEFNEAFAVLRMLGTQESPVNYFFFNMNQSQIDEARARLLFREKRWPDYVWYACSSRFRRCVALAAQGRFPEVQSLSQEGPLGERYGKKAFKEMGLMDRKQVFDPAFKSLLESAMPRLQRLSELSPGFIGEREFGDEFKAIFHELSSGYFDAKYATSVQPTMKPNKAL